MQHFSCTSSLQTRLSMTRERRRHLQRRCPGSEVKHLFSIAPSPQRAVAEGQRQKPCLQGEPEQAGEMSFICKRMPSLKLGSHPVGWVVFVFPQEVPAIYPTFQLGFSEAQRGRTCLSLYSESTARRGIRAHNPVGIAALAPTTGPCSPILFLVLSCRYVVCQEEKKKKPQCG